MCASCSAEGSRHPPETDIAFSRAEVQEVRAHPLPEKNASNRILQKLGMQFVTEIVDPDDGPFWRWQVCGSEYEAR
jgi:RimJ/RimL family protein N-acetyltransferase